MAKSKARKAGELTVEFGSGGKTTKVKGSLLGAAAMIIESKRRPPLESEVEVQFQPRPTSPRILARGVVDGHVGKKQIRVKFTDMAEEHRRHLLELLYPPGDDRRTARRASLRRTARRASLVTQMRTTVDEETLVGYTRDISTGGVFVETEQPLAKGAEVSLRFKLGPDEPILGARATVAYSLPDEGMGLRFVDLAAEVRQAIDAFVQ
jgi:uncharacterized protein (TIGR02266 family)